MRSVVVVGTGLIGTSVALALRAKGVAVYLRDLDDDALRTAVSLGAGTGEAPPGPVDLAVVAVPPGLVGRVLADLQAEGVARHFTDVASVKRGPQHDAIALACDTRRYLGGHPMSGAERTGPLAARANLFDGRTWVLTPTGDTETETVNTALELVSLCGAMPVLMDAAAHDRAVGLVSHMPHLVASLVAARLERAEDRAVSLAGPGVRDVTRIAGGDPDLWQNILSANAAVVADLLEEVATDLDGAIAGLRAMAATDEAKRRAGALGVMDLLRRGNTGRSRIPGKHGVRATAYEVVVIEIGDRPGELARLLTDAGRADVNIEDIRIEHSDARTIGLVHLSVAPGSAPVLEEILAGRGWRRR